MYRLRFYNKIDEWVEKISQRDYLNRNSNKSIVLSSDYNDSDNAVIKNKDRNISLIGKRHLKKLGFDSETFIYLEDMNRNEQSVNNEKTIKAYSINNQKKCLNL